jgi:hypothetical protein
MTETHLRDLAARFCARYSFISRPLQSEGAGKAGCALHPRSRVQLCKKHAHEHTGPAEAIRLSLRSGFTAYHALSPAIRPGIVTVIGGVLTADLTPALRRQDHTLLPSAPRAIRQRRTLRPPHPRPTSVTIANAPLSGTGFRKYRSDLGQTQALFPKNGSFLTLPLRRRVDATERSGGVG